MAQKLVNTQIQEQQLAQVQQQRLNAQQVMFVRMLEMPLTQYEEYVKTEIDENPALEPDIQENSDSDDRYDGGEEISNSNEDIDAAIDRYDDDRYDDDYVPTASASYATSDKAGNETPVWGNSESFYDTLHSQMGEQDLTERQELIMDYIIGSLDSDGLFRKDITSLSDEIAIHEYIDVSPEEIEKVLTILQGFDPAGIGAQNLQQCLLIQIFRKKATPLTKLMYQVINDYYEEFTRKHWKKIEELMQMDSITAEKVFGEIRKLNPRPGAALGETMGRNTQHVTPDFIVTVSEEGEIYFSMPKGRIPQLHVSQDFENMIQGYRQNPNSMTRSDKEALLYAQKKVSKAKAYIDLHADMATRIGKPMVMEEFGFPRDGFQFSKTSTTHCRDEFYAYIFSLIEADRAAKGPFAGCNFWGWGGFAEPSTEHIWWAVGDDYTGDPAQEQQGLNSVFASDESTCNIIRDAAQRLR